jgi:hypothetical protein
MSLLSIVCIVGASCMETIVVDGVITDDCTDDLFDIDANTGNINITI